MRAAVTAMQDTSKRIYEDEALTNVETKVAKVKEVFRIQGEDELKIADKKYL
jgi:phosphoenolpyruvate phosphomutase